MSFFSQYVSLSKSGGLKNGLPKSPMIQNPYPQGRNLALSTAVTGQSQNSLAMKKPTAIPIKYDLHPQQAPQPPKIGIGYTDTNRVATIAKNLKDNPLGRFAAGGVQGVYDNVPTIKMPYQKETDLALQQTQKVQPMNFGVVSPESVGRVFGSQVLTMPAFMATGGGEGIIKGIASPVLNRFANQALEGHLMTTAIQAPSTILGGISQGKNAGQVAQDVLKEQATSAIQNVGMAGVGALLGKVGSNRVAKVLAKEKEIAIAKTVQGIDNSVKPSTTLPNTLLPKVNTMLSKVENPSTVARTTSQVKGNGLVNNVLQPKTNSALPINTLDKIVSGKPTLLQNMKTALTPTAGRPKAILSDLYQRFVDVQNPNKAFSKATGAKVASENPYTMSMNASNSGGISNYILNEGLATKEGNTIAKSFNEIANEVPKNEQKLYEDYLLNKHNISRTAEGKPVFTTDINGNQVNIATSEKLAAQYEKDHPNFKTASNNLQNWWKSFMNEWGVKSGLIDSETVKIMREKYPNYVPTYREFASIERTNGVKGAKSEFVNQSNTLKKATGSDRNIISPMQSFTQLVQKMVKASKYNEVGQTVYNALKKDPEKLKAFAEIIPERDSFNLGNDLENGIDELSTQWQKAQSDLSKNNVVRVMVDGKPVHIQINDKSFLRALTGADQQPSANLAAKVLRKGTGAYKALITGDNPLFALTNIARDVPTYLINGTENNPIKALGTLGKAAKGVLTNSKEFQEYKALGGGGGGFFKQDYANLGKKGGLISKIEKFNNTTEQTPRFAEYLSTKNKLGNTYDAKVQGLYNANDVTTNFARHGDVTKSVDMGVPYLNPGVQGLDKVIRQVVTHPVGTLVKGVVAVTLPTVALDAINWNNPNYQALDNRTKDNYFLIPNGLDKDANGQAKTFIKIPKSREFGVLFGSLAERITRQVMGQPNSFKGFGSSAMSNIAPANPISSNFFTPAATLATGGNKDWAGRPIVPASLQNLSPKNQYDEKTSEIAKALGNMTGMSPKQIDYLITSYSGVIGQLGLPLATKSSYSNNIGGNLLSPITRKFTSDPLYSNQTMQDFYDNLAKAKTAAADKNLSLGANNQATPEDTINSQFTSAQSKISALQKQINVLNSSNDLQKQTKISDLRNQMIQAATDANSLLTGKLTPQQSLANSLSQFSASKTNKSDEIKQFVAQNPSVNAGTLSSRFSIPITQSRDVIKSVKDSSAASTYSDSVKKYLGLSKADMLKYYNALDAQSKALLDNQLSASGLNRYGNKK